MPRPKSAGGVEPKKRSRTGCWPCKSRKVKCGEEKPQCQHCVKLGETCDYSIRLNWGGRGKKDTESATFSVTPIHFAPIPAKRSPKLSPSVGSTVLSHKTKSAFRPPSRQIEQQLLPALADPQIDPQFGAPAQLPQPRQQWFDGRGFPPSFDYPATQSTIAEQAPLAQYHGEQSHHAPTRSRIYASYNQYVSPPTNNAQDSPSQGGELTADHAHLHGPRRSTADYRWSPTHGNKRLRLSPGTNDNFSRSIFAKSNLPDSPTYPPGSHDQPSSASSVFTAHSMRGALNTPLTSISTLVADHTMPKLDSRKSSLAVSETSDYRRLSVNSLLSGPDDHEGPTSHPSKPASRFPQSCVDGTTWYGYDYGLPDYDMPQNDDRNAIASQSTSELLAKRPSITGLSTSSGRTTPDPASANNRVKKDIAFERGGYYAQPVYIKIPTSLGPLPRHLTENPMNLLYFHHFLNHTGRILVPHDCPENPLTTILPQMACRDANLMNLLLAYSASHRARLLDHPEPANRIALWVRDVFPDLRAALSSSEPASDATLATAIMLASLEIVSPNTFDVPITWQNHLRIARQIVVSRGGLESLSRTNDKYIIFLCRWFAYLEVLGSLSGGDKSTYPLSGDYWPAGQANDDQSFQIDCFCGFTSRCISLLAQVARLGHKCDAERLDTQGNQLADWQGPNDEQCDQAYWLIDALEDSRRHVHRGCTHSALEPLDNKTARDIQEIDGSNNMFHWAGLINLHRRVLGRPSQDPEVQKYVAEIVKALGTVRPGSSTEGCLLFPMFTAGCDAVKAEDRQFILGRMKGIEGWGMTHVLKARTLMQKVWDTGKPWETLVAGEFFG